MDSLPSDRHDAQLRASVAHMDATERLAIAFDAWAALNRLTRTNPRAVTPEALSDAWARLEQAHEEWRNSR